jgi:hypothetical protein
MTDPAAPARTAQPFEAMADVSLKDGLICITITAPGAPETIIRLPKSLALEVARRIQSAALKAPASFPTREQDNEH